MLQTLAQMTIWFNEEKIQLVNRQVVQHLLHQMDFRSRSHTRAAFDSVSYSIQRLVCVRENRVWAIDNYIWIACIVFFFL